MWLTTLRKVSLIWLLFIVCVLSQNYARAYYLEGFKNDLLKGVTNLLEPIKTDAQNAVKEAKQIHDKMYEEILDLKSKVENIEKTEKKQMESDNIIINTAIMNHQNLEACAYGIYVSTRCYQVFMEKYNWIEAKDICTSNNLILAETSSKTIASALQSFLLHRYGGGHFWVNGDNSGFEGSELMEPGLLPASNTECLALNVLAHLDKPYHSFDCEDMFFALCERKLETTEAIVPDPISALDNKMTSQFDTMTKGPMKELSSHVKKLDKIMTNTNNILDDIKLGMDSKITSKLDVILKSTYCGGKGIFRLGTDCFYVALEPSTWYEARTSCQRKGGDLAQPTDLSSLKSYLNDNGMRHIYWVGGSDSGREGSYKWLSGRSISSSDWQSGQPDSNGDCVYLYPGSGLYDNSCTTKWKFICQR